MFLLIKSLSFVKFRIKILQASSVHHWVLPSSLQKTINKGGAGSSKALQWLPWMSSAPLSYAPIVDVAEKLGLGASKDGTEVGAPDGVSGWVDGVNGSSPNHI